MEVSILCEICGELIARADTETLSFPMSGSMFKSPDPYHDVPDPFPKQAIWEDFSCPYGRTHRPFTRDDAVMTDDGMYELLDTKAEAIDKNEFPLSCRYCGKQFSLSVNLSRHIKAKHKKGAANVIEEQ